MTQTGLDAPRRILVAGATGYIGQPVVRALVAAGHDVIALSRRRAGVGASLDAGSIRKRLHGAEVRFGDVTDPTWVAKKGMAGAPFDAVVSCLASRTGDPRDAWRIDHGANQHLLDAAMARGVEHFVYLSAICVQNPQLAFQHAKLAFEAALRAAPIGHAIVRPTAFFKSISGQVERVRRGRPFIVIGDGTSIACKPICAHDLANFIAAAVVDPRYRDRTLPIGGPGPALTPRDQGALLFELTGRSPRFREVPLKLLDAVVRVLSAAGRHSEILATKAELARIGRYYATESMLVRDAATGHYDADATPSFGTTTLRDHYTRVLRDGLHGHELGDHAVF
ncbi:MAG: NAD(P)H-binding protein [Myxococcota bacterium]